jgi:hypothetical protein
VTTYETRWKREERIVVRVNALGYSRFIYSCIGQTAARMLLADFMEEYFTSSVIVLVNALF